MAGCCLRGWRSAERWVVLVSTDCCMRANQKGSGQGDWCNAYLFIQLTYPGLAQRGLRPRQAGGACDETVAIADAIAVA